MSDEKKYVTSLNSKSTPIEYLDFYLYQLSLKHLNPTTASQLHVDIDNDVIMAIHSSEMILERLVKDGNATCKETVWLRGATKTLSGNAPITKTYSITFDGHLLLQNGGYRQKQIKDNNEDVRLRSLEDKSISLSHKMNTLTFWVVVGSVGLLIMEIIKFWVDHPHTFCFGH